MMGKYRRIFMTLGKIGTTIGEKIIAWIKEQAVAKVCLQLSL